MLYYMVMQNSRFTVFMSHARPIWYAGLLATLRRRLSRRAAADELRADSGDMSPLGSGAAAASFFRPLQSSSLTSDDERWAQSSNDCCCSTCTAELLSARACA